MFNGIIEQIIGSPQISVKDIVSLQNNHHGFLRQFDSTMPVAIDECVHSLIYKQACNDPMATAISAWDRQLSYSDLDRESSKIAKLINGMGYGVGDWIPLLLQRSSWVPVAMLGVMKSGAAFMFLEATQPSTRLRQICADTNSTTLLTTASLREKAKTILDTVVSVDEEDCYSSSTTVITSNACSTPSDALYAIFTSGSTGAPKGVVIEHGAFASSALSHAPVANYTSESRVLQFSSYAFDACMVEVMTTLIVGGCVCIPSEHDRWNDLPGAVARFEANLLFLTPSMLRGLEPSLFPSLKTILVGGEALSAGDFQRWLGSARVVQMYGPTECSAYSAATEPLHPLSDVRNIGNMAGARPWIVDPENAEILSPIGAVGELLLEGPIVGRGYLNRPEQTAAAFIDPPNWRNSFCSGPKRKLYRTGDLVQYANDGTIRILGRKDSQVKLRGQRIELGEIEHSLRDILPEYQHVCVELITLEDENRSAMIVALVGKENKEACERKRFDSSGAESTEMLRAVPDKQQIDIEDAKLRLSERLPHYMNPSLFLDIRHLPFTAGGKADRRRLRTEAARLASRYLLERKQQMGEARNRSSLTPWEKQLLELVGSVLSRAPDELTIHDDFFKVGGDSLRAMKLAQLARSKDIPLSVQTIFQNPKLSSMAKQFHHHDSYDSRRERATCPLVPPFSLLETHIKDSIIQEVSTEFSMEKERIEDIYPCTPLQEGMISLTLANPNAYIMQRTHTLSSSCDLQKLKRAWSSCIKFNPILRTRIVQIETGGSLQVVLSGEQEWLFGDDLETYLSLDRGKPMGLKEPLLRIALISEDTYQSYPDEKKHHVVVTMHHALYDGWSEGLILDQVESAYAGNSLTLHQFAPFVKHIEATKNDAETFWRNETRTLETSLMSFPPIHASDYQPEPNTILSCSMELTNEHKYAQATVSTQIRLAWAMSLRHFMASDTVVFGVIANGRNAPMSGIDAITGPTIATLPFKIQLIASNPIEDTLSDIQNKSTRMIPFEHFGLQNIRLLSASAAEECRFQSLLVVQPKPDQNHSDASSLMDVNDDTTAFDTYPLTLQCSIGEAHVEVQAIYDTTIISEAMMQHVLDHFTHNFGQISEHPTHSVDQIESLSHSAKAQLTKWYDALQDSLLSFCPSVCELVEKQCALRPESPAISAWDGEFSYSRLEKLSSAFAAHLVQLGIRIGSIVPICYEKSKWLAVILLGVIKTGAAFVLLDAFSHPIHRMQLIVDEVKGEVIITSKQLLATAEQLLEGQAVVISEDSSFFLQESEALMKELPQVEGCNALYAIFTSGSTGRPKGVVIEHGGYVAGVLSRQKVTGLDCDTRVLQFSSCSFDTFITDIFDTLIAGACICMPSETERSAGLSHFARSMSVTYADLVPSVARLLRPDEVPTIKILALSGEPMTTSDVTLWADKVRLCNLYGPAECSAVATAHVVSTSELNSANIGRVCGGISWVVSPTNHDVLLPIGAVGELVLEGPIVGRGYLGKVDERASSNFLQHLPKWRSMFPPAKSACRMYKTGDLVQYQMDGTLLFVGRKDSQVKLHGQRLELGDVEQHLRQAFSKSLDAVAIIVSRGSSSDHLAAFIVMPNDKNLHNSSGAPDSTSHASDLDAVQIAVNEEVRSDIHAAEALLRSLLPSFMVPTLYFPIHQLPRTPSGKVDRAKLTHIASELMSGKNIETFTARRQIRAPSTDAEEALRAIWALALAVEPSVIGVDDGFLKLGGDSIMAMKVASLAASRGLKLSIPKLFQNASLESLAADAQSKDTAQPIDWALETALPLSLQDSVGSKPHAGIKRPAATYMGDILLTGATGRLGRELLKQLIASPSVDKVHCVAVRQPGKCFTHEKIIIYQGDLSLPRLGMSEEEEASVLESSNAIIHCGARVSFVQDYETMRQVNVGSTKYLASMALKCQIPFHFISTVGVGHKNGDCNAAIEEVSAAHHAPPCDGHDGYTATKWASEVFLEKMHCQFSLPVTIHRPSNIICDGDPEADIVNNLIVYSRRLGMVPHLSGWEGNFDFVSGAAAATDIIGSVASGIQLPERYNSSGQSGVQYIHESGETVFPVNDLAAYLGHTDTEPLQTVGLRSWVNKALKAGMRNDVGKFLMDMDGSEEQIRMPRIKSRRVRDGQTLTATPVVTWAKLPAPAHRSV